MPSPLGNFFIKSLLNSPLHSLLGRNFAVITVTGRKTGKSITTPINTIQLENILTVTSLRSRTWWRNLRQGRLAKLRQHGKTLPVRAEVEESPEEVANSFEKYFRQFPDHCKYFGIQMGPAGEISPMEVERLAAERVIIRLFPAGIG